MSVLRTFVALELDPASTQRLERIARQLSKGNPGFTASTADQMHLTLAFLGEVELNDLHQVSKIVQQSFEDVDAFTLGLQDLGAFPHWQDPKVVWVGVAEDGVDVDHLSEAALERLGSAAYCPALTELQDQMVQRFLDQRFWPDTKPFRPHITLGRMRGGKGNRNLEIPDSVQQQVEAGLGQFPVDSVKVMSSESTSNGPVYRTISTLDL